MVSLRRHPIPFILAEKSGIALGDFEWGLGKEWAHVRIQLLLFATLFRVLNSDSLLISPL